MIPRRSLHPSMIFIENDALKYVKRRKQRWPDWSSKAQPLDWQHASVPTELSGIDSIRNRNDKKKTKERNIRYISTGLEYLLNAKSNYNYIFSEVPKDMLICLKSYSVRPECFNYSNNPNLDEFIILFVYNYYMNPSARKDTSWLV